MLTRRDVVICAAGSGTRFGGDKLAAELGGISVLSRSVLAFLADHRVAHIIIATPDGARPAHLDANENRLLAHVMPHANSFGAPKLRKLRFVRGGATRAESVRAALSASESEWVAVHDAARPLVSADLIGRCFDAGTCVPCVPVTGTVKRATGEVVEATVPRDGLWLAQTPQCFRRDDWLAAWGDGQPDVTDDAGLLERAGHTVRLVRGEGRNLKITTAEDLALAHALLAAT